MSERIIAALATENVQLKCRVNQLRSALDAIATRLVCIGGPLNDNKHGYSKDQLEIFHRLMEIVEGAEPSEETP